MDSPILLLVFNRPKHTALVFNKIREQKPRRLFIGADGPRAGRNDDKDLCNEVRAIVSQIDWPCEVHTLFRDENLGAGKAVSEAIYWFFDHVEQGIILEDDCLADDTFFTFCDTLLNKYADTKEIMVISGTNMLREGWKPEKQSYHFGHGGVWGWATWKRAWNLYDYDMPGWANKTTRNKIRIKMSNDNWFNYFAGMYNAVYEKKLDAWDLQWLYCIFNNDGLCINPSVNLVSNIGFGTEATNTVVNAGPYSQMEVRQMKFPLKHPVKFKIDKQYLRVTFRFVFQFGNSSTRIIKSWIRLYLKKFKQKLTGNYDTSI